jgi:hypothetical protein
LLIRAFGRRKFKRNAGYTRRCSLIVCRPEKNTLLFATAVHFMNIFIAVHAGNLLRFAFAADAFYSNAKPKYKDVECCEVLGLCKGNGFSVLSSRTL